ncbi:hypothetical protein MTO96_022469 [Rhipicephalus appendiculatus]
MTKRNKNTMSAVKLGLVLAFALILTVENVSSGKILYSQCVGRVCRYAVQLSSLRTDQADPALNAWNKRSRNTRKQKHKNITVWSATVRSECTILHRYLHSMSTLQLVLLLMLALTVMVSLAGDQVTPSDGGENFKCLKSVSLL